MELTISARHVRHHIKTLRSNFLQKSHLILIKTLGVFSEKINTIFVDIGQNGWEGHCLGPQLEIQNIVVTGVGKEKQKI